MSKKRSVQLALQIVAWLAYYIFAGPYLFSADSWVLVSAGVLILAALVAVFVAFIAKLSQE